MVLCVLATDVAHSQVMVTGVLYHRKMLRQRLQGKLGAGFSMLMGPAGIWPVFPAPSVHLPVTD